MIPGASVGEPVLLVRDVTVSRGVTPVLDRVAFEVPDRIRDGRTTGQVVSLLGPSGIGKTTLLRVIAGLERAEKGEVVGHGGGALGAADVGIVFQHYPLLSHRTVEGNLLLAARVGGLDETGATKRVRELLERLGISDRARAYPAQLSGGQRQRAAIAQQLVQERRVLLLDEPFSGLDPVALSTVEALIGEIANEHELNTVIVVTHDVRSALRVSDLVVLLGAGETRGAGARVRGCYDLVDLGVAWEYGRALPERLAAIGAEIERRFRELGQGTSEAEARGAS